MRTEPHLRLDDRFTHLVEAAGTVVLVEDEDAFPLEDGLTSAVALLLDGRRTAVDIASSLSGVHPPAEVHYVLLRLLREGLVREVAPEADEADSVSEAPRPEEGSLAGALASLWREREAPVVVVPPEVWAGPAAEVLILVDDYLRPELAARVAAEEMGSARPALLARPARDRIWLGPVLGPGRSCLTCLQDRLRLNLNGRSLLHAGASFEVVTLPSRIPDAALDRLADLLRDAAIPESLAKHLLAVGSAGADGGRRHRVPRLPHCPACGDPTLTVPGPDLTVGSRPRTAVSLGGYRIVPPEETLARYTPLVSPLVGVVRRLEKLPVDGTDLVHAYTASHAHHYGAGTVRAVKDDRRDHSGGKGRSDAEARASALCESLERFSSVHRGDEPVRLARRSDLEDALAPNDLMHFSAAQYAEREAWNAIVGHGFQSVPESYGDEVIAWSPVRNLTDGGLRQVPSAFLFYGFQGEGARFCDGDSNGLAGGNCVEEAILQGFLEVVERDAVALWWYSRAPRPSVPLETDDPWIAETSALYARLDRDVWALDLTTDLGIPTYAAVSARRRNSRQDIIFGFGAHLDARIALTRALSELNQMLPTVLQPRKERRRRLLPDFEDAVRWWDEATLVDEPHLLPAGCAPRWPVLPTDGNGNGDLRDDLSRCIERAAAVGCDVLAYDLTRPDVRFPVVKVIVPGLRHFWRRLGPGRLYDVPVRLRWVPRALAEDELNPRSVFV
jgi:ribosomal protein S12 methylthiotransferase accessory factor